MANNNDFWGNWHLVKGRDKTITLRTSVPETAFMDFVLAKKNAGKRWGTESRIDIIMQALKDKYPEDFKEFLISYKPII